MPGASARFWTDGEGWRVQVGSAVPEEFSAETAFSVGVRTFRGVAVALERAGQKATALRGRLHAPVRLVTNFDAVTIHREGQPALTIGGIGARILSELAEFGGPVEWSTLAGQIWGDTDDRLTLRRKLDVALSRLRSRLRSAGSRPDFVKNDGTGKVSLLLQQGDTVENRN